ncbi:hypothetical protein [Pontiella sp.]|uniref:hypothetical protein n=1 Tax=Pontiella sp. TaxID=2837462 RepID=UPI00356164A5
MVLSYLLRKNRIFEFPFWAGMIALGWFFPQAIGGLSSEKFPEGAYAAGMLFATLCTSAMWGGYVKAVNKQDWKPGWLEAQFDMNRLYHAGVILCFAGFYFQWKLLSLPEEVLNATQWSGAAVKYLFLSSVFRFGFLALWLLYLIQNRKADPRYLVLLIPCLLLLLDAAILRGRRAAMMDVVAYLLISLWFVRRISLPRWMLLGGLLVGLVLINAIGVYRGIMKNENLPLRERMKMAMKADYTQESKDVMEKSGHEFNNYIIFRHAYTEVGEYDFGLKHWNGLVFNYVPAQIVGRATKKALMLPENYKFFVVAKQKYGYTMGVGTTLTGYLDAFGSFWWLGFIKFYLIGWIMGTLYRNAMVGSFLAQLLYVYVMNKAMQSVSHGTHAIMLSVWVYFFALGYPAFLWAKLK